MSETRAAWAELLAVLAEAGERFAGEEWMVVDDRDVAEAHRTIAHILQSGLVSHADPGVPNWIDTEGRPSGTLFFRFFLPEGDMEPLGTEVVPFAEIGA